MKKITKIFVDMDGVLADFIKGVEGPKYLNGPMDNSTYNEKKIVISNNGLFRNLPPMVDMPDLINYINDLGVYWEILTCTGEINRQKVAKDKTAWIREHVDPDTVVTCTFKGVQKAAYAKPGYILIDDHKKNINAWIEAGGIGILYTTAADCIKQIEDLRYKAA